MRKPFQGLWNVIRFNWPFYVLALAFVPVVLIGRYYLNASFKIGADVLLLLVVGSTLVSLLVSLYVYDLSGFYKLEWLKSLQPGDGETIVNINAGFDETSALLKATFGAAEMIVCDFYEPARHTEASIRRARQAYPPFPSTLRVPTNELPLNDDSADKIFAIFSAHEIRDVGERNTFFTELNRTLSPNGQVIVVEHLRDTANFLAYNVGAFHFHSRSSWLSTFRAARFNIEYEIEITPFVTAFFLNKNGIAS